MGRHPRDAPDKLRQRHSRHKQLVAEHEALVRRLLVADIHVLGQAQELTVGFELPSVAADVDGRIVARSGKLVGHHYGKRTQQVRHLRGDRVGQNIEKRRRVAVLGRHPGPRAIGPRCAGPACGMPGCLPPAGVKRWNVDAT